MAELAAELEEADALVLVGHCVELGEHEIPYAPVTGALPTLLEPAELDDVAGSAAGDLGWLVPGLGEADPPTR